jgi:polar amino acid transport system substrate-binding protein
VFTYDEAPYCPFTGCDQGKDGFVIEIIREIFSAKGYSVVFRSRPWTRAILEVQWGDATGVLAMGKGSAPELIFPKSEIAQLTIVAFSSIKNPWWYQEVDSLRGLRLGLIPGYGYADVPGLGAYIDSNKESINWVAGKDPLLRIFQMIEAGRVDAAIEDITVGKYVSRQGGLEGKIKVAGSVMTEPELLYVGFSPKNPMAKLYAQEFDQGIAELRRTGRLSKILEKYGTHDWAKRPQVLAPQS